MRCHQRTNAERTHTSTTEEPAKDLGHRMWNWASDEHPGEDVSQRNHHWSRYVARPRPPPKPDNVIYILGEFNELMKNGHELLEPGTFDLVYQKMLVMGVTSRPQHLQLVKSFLKPGGYFESQEMDFWKIYDKNNKLVSQDWKFLEVSLRAPAEQGINLKAGEILPGHLEEARFEDVEQKRFPMAFQTGWRERPETETMAKYLNWACRPWWYRYFEKGAREGEDADALSKDFQSKVLDGEIGLHGHVVVTLGRKF
ncbi:hypothetical protein M409DRAFT_23764 [Zasmidium cellare ATCC 36951]|uniref:Methyltransferase type 11 domain-containing protein n=1 Tax=Zasmidium cellare ATCC 36951 TaxID=1080233 RepID=A0A6A6CFM6_ZASCE|nr:uncharacterized protein M409DRAFT_23764 [Zasmidium cellare ATCC 36951]KAF2166037.1 hypothetical protein M409DRAFT_23764 [Zasmidium cellare ATCC 36951]